MVKLSQDSKMNRKHAIQRWTYSRHTGVFVIHIITVLQSYKSHSTCLTIKRSHVLRGNGRLRSYRSLMLYKKLWSRLSGRPGESRPGRLTGSLTRALRTEKEKFSQITKWGTKKLSDKIKDFCMASSTTNASINVSIRC